jgi:hypothetical protein
VGLVVDRVAMGQVFLRLLSFSSVSIIPSVLHIYSFIHSFNSHILSNGPSLSNMPKDALLDIWTLSKTGFQTEHVSEIAGTR